MKTRILATLATAGFACAAANVSAQELEFDTTFGVESEYVFRGVEIAGNSFQGSLNASYGDTYFGVWAHEAFDSVDRMTSEFDFYVGHGYALNDRFNADFGATVYHYPDFGSSDNTFETYFGLTMDAVAAPSLYVYYDFDLKNWTYEGALSHSFDIDESNAIVVGTAAGWVDTGRNMGDDYWYYNATVDFVHSFSDSMSASIGVRAGGNDDHRGFGGREHNVWAGASLSAGF